MNVSGNLLTFVNDKSKQIFRQHPCCKRGINAYLYSPQNILIPFQLKTLVSQSIEFIDIVNVDSYGKESVTTTLSNTLIQKHDLGQISYHVYNSLPLSLSLPVGKYYIEIKFSNRIVYSQLFEVVSCCLDRIEWKNKCNKHELSLLYENINYTNVVYFPSRRAFVDVDVEIETETTYNQERLISKKVSEFSRLLLGQFFDVSIGALETINKSGSVIYFSSDGSYFKVKESTVNLEISDFAANVCAKTVIAQLYKEDIENSQGCCISIAETSKEHLLPPVNFQDCNGCNELFDLQATSSSNSVLLNWTGQANVVRYSVYDTTAGQTLLGTTTADFYEVTGLSHCTEYSFLVIAECRNDVATGTEITVTTQDLDISISNLQTTVNQTQITVSWESIATNFEIRWGKVGGDKTTVSQTAKTFTISDLSISTQYVFEVKAIGDCSETVFSNIIALTGDCALSMLLLTTSQNCETGEGEISITALDFVGNYRIYLYDNNLNEIDSSINEALTTTVEKGYYSIKVVDDKCEVYEKTFVSACTCDEVQGITTLSESRGLAVNWQGTANEVYYQLAESSTWILADSTNSIQGANDKIFLSKLIQGQSYRVKVINKCGESVQNELISEFFVYEYCNPCVEETELQNNFCDESFVLTIDENCCEESFSIETEDSCLGEDGEGFADQTNSEIENNPITIAAGETSNITLRFKNANDEYISDNGGVIDVNFASTPIGLSFVNLVLHDDGTATAAATATTAGIYTIDFTLVF